MSAVLTFALAAFGIGGVFFWLSMRRRPADYKRERWIKYLTYIGIAMAAIAAWRLGAMVLAALVAVIAARGGQEIHVVQAGAGRGKLPSWIWPSYLLIVAWALIGVLMAPPDTTIFVFVVVATFDGCSQVVGQLIGRRKLTPRLSPNKTVEGLAGGLVMACVAALALGSLNPLPGPFASLVGVPMGLVGLAGDLAASWIKRRAGVKDYPSILPGHGGVLDRFDGLLPNLAVLGVLSVIFAA